MELKDFFKKHIDVIKPGSLGQRLKIDRAIVSRWLNKEGTLTDSNYKKMKEELQKVVDDFNEVE
jgi:hypothetical protein